MKSILILLSLFALVHAQEKSLTLSKAWEMAIQGNPTEAIFQSRLQQASARLEQTKGRYQPTVSLEASGSRLDYSETQKSRIPNAPSSVEQFDAGVQISWLLWDGGVRKNQAESLKRALEATQAGKQDARETLLAQVGRAFTSAQLARENLNIAQEDVAFQQRQLDQSIRKEKAGVDSRADRLNFEIRKLSAENSVVQQRARYIQSMAVLAALLGVDESTTLPEPAALYTKKPEMKIPDPIEDWPEVQRTLPSLRESALTVQAAEYRIDSQKGVNRPDVALFGNVRVDREDDPNFAGDDVSNTVGIQVSWNVWDGAINRNQVAELEAARDEAIAFDRQNRLQARSRFRQAIVNVNASIESLDITYKSNELSRENRDLIEASYKAGRENLLRLNEAQRDFNNAGFRYAAARLQVQLDWIELQRAMGKLEEFTKTWNQ
jgi:outer membrane protein TolC